MLKMENKSIFNLDEGKGRKNGKTKFLTTL
jgi:hypothetical protein